ncbi:MAG: hypothetical protein EOP10_28235 [Proteobacteria bacterium]|nr:MAG: hypothetical protein EOP10_28235 [Pseudomonadota bacterium]
MTAYDFTIELFCRVDDVLKEQTKHVLAQLYPSEVVTLGLLQALRGEGNCAFYRWVEKELATLFPRLPERTRLFRLFVQFENLCQQFLAQPTLFGVADSFGIELVHPWRERRTQREVARKGLSNHRWIVGAKLAVVTDDCGQIVGFQVKGANVHDTAFHTLIETWKETMIVLADQGFKAQDPAPKKKAQGKKKKAKQTQGDEAEEVLPTGPLAPTNPVNLKICPKGQWNERMIVETVFSLFTSVLHLKKLTHRLLAPLQARLAYTCAAFNLCTAWNGEVKLQLASFAL